MNSAIRGSAEPDNNDGGDEVEEFGPNTVVDPADAASYVLDITRGLRRLTSRPGEKLEMLDYFLAMAEEEAVKLSSQVQQ